MRKNMKNLENKLQEKELKKPYISLFEMSQVREFENGAMFYTKPSSKTPVSGSRQEHLPPHIELYKNNESILKLHIPSHQPTSTEDIQTIPEITNSKKRKLLKWFNKVRYEPVAKRKITAYELCIIQWSQDNRQYEIMYKHDKDENVIITKWPTR